MLGTRWVTYLFSLLLNFGGAHTVDLILRSDALISGCVLPAYAYETTSYLQGFQLVPQHFSLSIGATTFSHASERLAAADKNTKPRSQLVQPGFPSDTLKASIRQLHCGPMQAHRG
jgi:glutamine cyclotransferase